MSKTAALQVHHPFFVLFFVFCFLCFVFCFVFFFFFFFLAGGGGGGGGVRREYTNPNFPAKLFSNPTSRCPNPILTILIHNESLF